MFKEKDIVVYGNNGVCVLQEKVTKKIGGKEHEYYALRPYNKEGMVIFVPLDNDLALTKLRNILSREEIDNLIETMPDNNTEWIQDANMRKKKYNEIVNTGDHHELVKLIKALYINKEIQEVAGKKFHIQDKNLLELAESMLYDEFSVVLGIEPEEVLPYILDSIEKSKEAS